MLLLVPADAFSPRSPDEHFAAEATAARDLGHEVAVVDHDALTRPDGAGEAVRRVPHGAGQAAYRGWMLPSEQYDRFAAALERRGVTLRTDSTAYRQAHELPGWYEAMRGLTPETVWSPGTDPELAARLGEGPAVVRDFVKSEKHHWDEAMFIPDVADPEATARVVERFVELRGEWLVGGLVVRRYEPFEGPEVRTWWVDGRCALVTAHPDTPNAVPPSAVEVDGLDDAVQGMGVAFVTVDLAQCEGRWRVVEVGDGQVSDRARSTSPDEFVAALF